MVVTALGLTTQLLFCTLLLLLLLPLSPTPNRSIINRTHPYHTMLLLILLRYHTLCRGSMILLDALPPVVDSILFQLLSTIYPVGIFLHRASGWRKKQPQSTQDSYSVYIIYIVCNATMMVMVMVLSCVPCWLVRRVTIAPSMGHFFFFPTNILGYGTNSHNSLALYE